MTSVELMGGIFSKLTTLSQIDWNTAEFCYPPIIQSQSTSTGYDISPNAESSQDDISHKGVLLVSLGMRYRSYCANLGRSFIVDPSKVGCVPCYGIKGTHPYIRSKKRIMPSW